MSANRRARAARPGTTTGKVNRTSYDVGVFGCVLANANEIDGQQPNLSRLVKEPSAYDDMRCQRGGEVVNELLAEQKPVHPAAVLERLKDVPDAATFLQICQADALPVSVAEFEAETVWKFYQNRKTASLLNHAINELITTKSPTASAVVRRSLISELQRLDADNNSLAERLKACQFDPSANHERPAPVYSIDGKPVSTVDNLTNILAQAKHGKTAVNGAMIASTFAAPDADCLGITSENPKGFAVGHLDTEQSPFDHAEQNRLIERRAGQPLPKWFESFHLAGFKAADIRAAIPLLMEQWKKRFGGIHSVFVDGIADAAQDVNDPAESNAFVAELHALAIKFHCSIILSIHLNPGSDFKTRGHLGSQLERKAETNLKIEKDVDEICVLFAEKNRHAAILKKNGPRFTWDNEKRMHVRVQSQQDAKEDLEFAELSKVFKTAFGNHPSLSFSDLRTATVSALKVTDKKPVSVSDRTAERKIARADTLGIIKKEIAGFYTLKV
jgi:hypothetical protein